jgi:hypothetical protein
MQPETKATINRIRKSRTVRVLAIGVAGAVIYTKVMHSRGYNMVKPVQFNTDGTVLFTTVTGRICRPNLETL